MTSEITRVFRVCPGSEGTELGCKRATRVSSTQIKFFLVIFELSKNIKRGGVRVNE